MVPTGTAVNPSNTWDPGSEDVHKATGEQIGEDGKELEEGDKTQQCALPARGKQGAGDEGRGPFEPSRALNACRRQGGGKRGGTPTQQRVTMARSKGPGRKPADTVVRAPTARPGTGGGKGTIAPAVRATRAQAGGEGQLK